MLPEEEHDDEKVRQYITHLLIREFGVVTTDNSAAEDPSTKDYLKSGKNPKTEEPAAED